MLCPGARRRGFGCWLVVNLKKLSEPELFRGSKRQLNMSVRSKWWPLPSHAPTPIPKSKFSFPKVATVKMLYRGSDGKPTSETVWLKPWRVPVSERIADQVEWHSIIGKLG
jgi:hypothetical protein